MRRSRLRAVVATTAVGALLAVVLPAAPAFASSPIPGNQHAANFYTMNGAQSTMVDSVTTSGNASLNSTGGTTPGEPTIVPSETGTAVQFSGNGGGYDSTSSNPMTSTTSWTFTGWIEIQGALNNATIMDIGSQNVGGVDILINNSDQVEALFNQQTYAPSSSGTVTYGQPTYIEVTYQSPTISYYINGQAAGSFTNGGGDPRGWDNYVGIGEENGVRAFTGEIQDVGWLNSVDTSAQDASNYSAYTSGASTGTGSGSGSGTGTGSGTGGNYNGASASQEGGFFSTLGGVFTGGLSAIAKVLENVLGALESVGSDVLSIGSDIVDGLESLGSSLISALSSLGTDIGDFFSTLENDLVPYIENAVDYLFVPSGSSNPLTELLSNIDQTEPFSTIKSGVLLIPDSLQSLQGGISNGGANLPSFDGFQVGNSFQDAFAQNQGAESAVRTVVLVFISVLYGYGVFRTLMGVISKSKD